MFKLVKKAIKRTSAASTARRAAYEQCVRHALPFIRVARDSGARTATEFAHYLSEKEVQAPTKNGWSERAVTRALERLKQLGLDEGSLKPGQARKESNELRRERTGKTEKYFGSEP